MEVLTKMKVKLLNAKFKLLNNWNASTDASNSSLKWMIKIDSESDIMQSLRPIALSEQVVYAGDFDSSFYGDSRSHCNSLSGLQEIIRFRTGQNDPGWPKADIAVDTT